MDAAALLKSQGWRGKGHSLHPTDNSIGLANPLLLSRNSDGRGIGQKKHFTSDQWWLDAFDQKLKGLDTSGKGVVQSVTNGALDLVTAGNGKFSGTSSLYATFVRGGMLEGTMTPDSAEETTDATPTSQNRESVPGLRSGLKKETKEERRARKAAKMLGKAERKESEKMARKLLVETKEERRVRRAERRAGRVERQAERAERRARKEARRKKRQEKEARKQAKEARKAAGG
ncbi:hypothetical protein QBC33DRAFT_77137 [Phialemonium atrogriseum]|uniref:G-patch domain-containing protein n=1 Tax=Phialemonium atrogriseum TaxID=1093897 RepID=A0AAJ0C078_9PEZI|nr:uncharacterized protein QBC33DRAFT_77137 [Phialemonium atrogriseum]KAK1767087.1 hypothetical protein QBC33DRAFT_77137 [Phialemonium atrogriseum]